MAVGKEELLGSWQLEWARVVKDGAVIDPVPFGPDPLGVIHYLPDGRMAALISHRGRPHWQGGRAGASDAERIAAARSFVAYAGRYTIEPDRIVHHVDINNYPNDVGTDYVRFARLEGDALILTTPTDLGDGQRPMELLWRRITDASARPL